jgi:hypothetical protein
MFQRQSLAHVPKGQSMSRPEAAGGEELTRSVAGNIIESRAGAWHPARREAALDENRRRQIEIAAYYRAERRGFAPGGELEDWLEAERELLEQEGAGVVG